MKCLIILLSSFFCLYGCRNSEPEQDPLVQAQLNRIKIDSMVDERMTSMMFDTTNQYNCPITIDSFYLDQTLNFPAIQFYWTNNSNKSAEAIRFKIYMVDAFGDPVETDVTDKHLRGFQIVSCEKPTLPNTQGAGFRKLSGQKIKRIKKIWVTEIAFDDESKWKSE